MKIKKSFLALAIMLSVALLCACSSEQSSPKNRTTTKTEKVASSVKEKQKKKEPEHIKLDNQDFNKACKKMDKLIADYPFTSEVLVYSLDKGNIYYHNIDELMYSASTVKLTYVYYCCTEIEKGNHTLDETYEYTENYYSDGSGAIQYMDFGTMLSLQEIINYTMLYSDNIGYNMLVSIFGPDGYNQLMSEMGYGMQISYQNYYTQLNAQVLKDFMLKVYEKRNDDFCWQVVWNALIWSTDSIMKKEIGNLGDMAVKCGTVEGIYHEVVFLDTDSPYIIAVLTKTNLVDEGDEELFRSIAKCANEMIEAIK